MRKLISAIFITIFFSSSVLAQEKSLSLGKESITTAELRDHIYYLASDSLRGRFMQEEFQIAANYAVSQFQQSGLEPGYVSPSGKASFFQPVYADKYSYDYSKTNLLISIRDKEYSKSFGEDFYINFGRNPHINETKGEVVFVGYGIKEPNFGWNDYEGVDIKNKWVIFMETIPDSILNKFPEDTKSLYKGSPKNEQYRINSALEEGAIGAISVRPDSTYNNWSREAALLKNYCYKDDIWYDVTSNCLTIDTTTIKTLFKNQVYNPLNSSGVYQSFSLDNTIITFRSECELVTYSTCNILALIEGTDPELKDEIITIGAHLDHLGEENDEIFNGADDNASGCAGILEIAEALSQSKPKRSILFLLYSLEEMGLLGSKYYTHHPTFPIDNIKVNFSLDMIGRIEGKAENLSVIGADRINTRLKDRIIEVNNRTENILLDFRVNRLINASDQYSFHLAGIPSALITSGLHKDYHKPNDDPEKIDYDFLRKNCRLTYEIILDLANGDLNLLK